MSELYERLEPKEGTLAQFAAVHVVKWRPEWGEPTAFFVEAAEQEVEPSGAAVELLNGVMKQLEKQTARPVYNDVVKNPYQTSQCDLKPGDVFALTVVLHVQHFGAEDGRPTRCRIYRCPLGGYLSEEGVPQGGRYYEQSGLDLFFPGLKTLKVE